MEDLQVTIQNTALGINTHCADGAHTWRHAQTCTETRREQTRICSRARADTHTHMHTIFLPVSY